MALQNHLRQATNAVYTPRGCIKLESKYGKINLGDWRASALSNTMSFRPMRGSRPIEAYVKLRRHEEKI